MGPIQADRYLLTLRILRSLTFREWAVIQTFGFLLTTKLLEGSWSTKSPIQPGQHRVSISRPAMVHPSLCTMATRTIVARLLPELIPFQKPQSQAGARLSRQSI